MTVYLYFFFISTRVSFSSFIYSLISIKYHLLIEQDRITTILNKNKDELQSRIL
jgi:hypothetical protein